MKNNLIIILVAFLVSLTSFSQNVSGVYNTDYRQMTLSQTGNTVTGTYEGSNGKIQAILNGNKLTGTWRNNGNNKTGNFEFIFNSDFSAYTGKFGYNNGALTKKWNGTKTKSTGSINVVPTQSASITNIAGEYTTDYDKMILSQTGNTVTGTYEGSNGKIQAILNGNKLTGTWRNNGNNKTGNFEFIFNSDFSAYTGKFGYNNGALTKKWNGTKIKSTSSTNVDQTPTPVTITNIAGEYTTDYGKMILSQTGNTVTGTYEGANGKIQATLNENKLTGTWRNNGNNKTGNFEFIFNSDFSAYTGKFGYNNGALTKKWNGTKTKSSSSTNVEQTPQTVPIANILGEYTTDYGKMTLIQSGNTVTGTYEGANGKIQAILNGNKLTGTWRNNGNNKTGNFEFIFNSDFSAYTGKFGYNNGALTKKWNGTKTKSSSSTSTTINTQTNLPINIIGSWSSNGSRNHRGRANIWQEGNQFTVVVSWIDEERNLWKSYKGEGQFEGREMHFKVFPAVSNGSTVDQGYVYHWTVSSDSNQITGYYTRYGEKTVETTVYYKRVE